MRRIIRGFLWLIKGTLLVIALAALVLWPLSYGYKRTLWLLRYTVQTERVYAAHLTAGVEDGFITIGDYHDEAQGEAIRSVSAEAKRQGNGWHSMNVQLPPAFSIRNVGHPFGPVRWSIFTNKQLGHSVVIRSIWCPCWLLFLSAAIWPLTSLTLLHRRRASRRHLARAGCCAKCGYDLRASPDRCPECGALPEAKA